MFLLWARNISAHAEKTQAGFAEPPRHQKHLCPRPATAPRMLHTPTVRETSLRMQRKLTMPWATGSTDRNISAHAEKTQIRKARLVEDGKHLCACRENISFPLKILYNLETSLRMQRKLIVFKTLSLSRRNISAHAEKTSNHLDFSTFLQKHLCACRENNRWICFRY